MSVFTGTAYVLGLAFDYNMDNVVLIKKNKGPEQFLGKWQGIGGKIKVITPETLREAMVREFKEETGVITLPKQWHCFLIKEYASTLRKSLDAKCYFFAAFGDFIKNVRTVTDEEIKIETIEGLHFEGLELYAYDLPYLIQMVRKEVMSGNFKALNPEGVNHP